MDQQVFKMDGVAYNVSVTALTRKFSVMDTDKSGRTQDGAMYRDIIGTFYNYTMTIRERGGDAAALDAFWQAISSPTKSHVCEFPYGQETLTQQMYVTSGEQALKLMQPDKNHWGEISVNFIAMKPEVVAG
ncbi:MAG: hypothetical protein IJ403_01580 [Oscillospiraceae bacterium]|nr:hypothetical protein [Oscillospiraceae bacterium]